MAFSNLEKAMAAYIGLDLAIPGMSREVVKRALSVTARRAVAPTAVGIGGLARRYPAPAAAIALGGAYEAGLLDPVPPALASVAEQVILEPQRKKVARRKSTHNKAVSMGMKAIKASTSYGKKGTINNAKKAFGAVNKVASKLNRGKKVSTKGPTGVIKRAIGKFFPKKKPVRRTQGKTTYTIKVNR